MPCLRVLAVGAALLLCEGTAQCGPVGVPVDVPAFGRPRAFSGAVGERFQATMSVPPEVRVGRPFRLTLRVVAQGRWWHSPARPDLRDLPAFRARFELSLPPLPEGSSRTARLAAARWETGPDRQWPDEGAWEFDYQLKLRDGAVPRVPPLALGFYTPSANPELPGRFPTTFAPEVPLKFASDVVPPPTALVPILVPERFWHIDQGPAVLAHPTPSLPPLPWLALGFAMPPLGALAWGLVRLGRLPVEARQARQRQSRAARQALQALTRLGPVRETAAVAPLLAVVAQYLRDRLGVTGSLTTPVEVAAEVQRAGGASEVAAKVAEFVRACDAVRYGPPGISPGDLNSAARELIHLLETATWSSAA